MKQAQICLSSWHDDRWSYLYLAEAVRAALAVQLHPVLTQKPRQIDLEHPAAVSALQEAPSLLAAAGVVVCQSPHPHWDTGTQGHRDTGTQGYRDTGTQGVTSESHWHTSASTSAAKQTDYTRTGFNRLSAFYYQTVFYRHLKISTYFICFH